MSTAQYDIECHYEALPFSLEHYPQMKVLFKSAFGIDVREEDFRKRFDTVRLGSEVVGFIALHKASQHPAAYYGVFPVTVILNNKAVLAAQSGDTMTHHHHRKKGLFVWLARKTFQQCREKGIELVFGLPNKNSYPGFVNHLSWVHLDNIYTYDLKLNIKTVPIPKLLNKLGVFHWYIKGAKAILKGRMVSTVQEFTNTYRSSIARVQRNQAYLHYKESASKLFVRLNGVTAWIQLTDVLWVGDFDNYDLVDGATLKTLKRLAAVLGYNTIRFHFNGNLQQPAFLQAFKKSDKEPSCFCYLNSQWQGNNMVLTAADFDTW